MSERPVIKIEKSNSGPTFLPTFALIHSRSSARVSLRRCSA